jgi:hypothetical protein
MCCADGSRGIAISGAQHSAHQAIFGLGALFALVACFELTSGLFRPVPPARFIPTTAVVHFDFWEWSPLKIKAMR